MDVRGGRGLERITPEAEQEDLFHVTLAHERHMAISQPEIEPQLLGLLDAIPPCPMCELALSCGILNASTRLFESNMNNRTCTVL